MSFSKYIVECNNDKIFVMELFGVGSKMIHHAFGKTNVLKVLQKSYNSLALIDEDPRSVQPPMLRKIKVDDVGNGIKVGQFKSNMLVILCPNLEEWVVRAASETNPNQRIDEGNLSKTLHGDPNEFRKVVGQLKSSSSVRVRRLRDFITNREL